MGGERGWGDDDDFENIGATSKGDSISSSRMDGGASRGAPLYAAPAGRGRGQNAGGAGAGRGADVCRGRGSASAAIRGGGSTPADGLRAHAADPRDRQPLGPPSDGAGGWGGRGGASMRGGRGRGRRRGRGTGLGSSSISPNAGAPSRSSSDSQAIAPPAAVAQLQAAAPAVPTAGAGAGAGVAVQVVLQRAGLPDVPFKVHGVSPAISMPPNALRELVAAKALQALGLPRFESPLQLLYADEEGWENPIVEAADLRDCLAQAKPRITARLREAAEPTAPAPAASAPAPAPSVSAPAPRPRPSPTPPAASTSTAGPSSSRPQSERKGPWDGTFATIRDQERWLEAQVREASSPAGLQQQLTRPVLATGVAGLARLPRVEARPLALLTSLLASADLRTHILREAANTLYSSLFGGGFFTSLQERLYAAFEPSEDGQPEPVSEADRRFVADAVALLTELVTRFPNSALEMRGPAAAVRTGLSMRPEAFGGEGPARALLAAHEEASRRSQRAFGAPAAGGPRARADPREATPSDGSYRAVSILPTAAEIASRRLAEQILRKIKPRGDYVDAATYLETHFGLLREDCVRPMREGVHDFLEGKSNREFRIYDHCQVIGMLTSRYGVMYRVSFVPRGVRRAINWERSQRLKKGTLVCLSADGFRTVAWAIVAGRDPKLLANPAALMIDLQLPEEQDAGEEAAGLLQVGAALQMAESSAVYFEAYRHVLRALQLIDPARLPFQETLVRCGENAAIGPPAYLRAETELDLSPVLRDRTRAARARALTPAWPALDTCTSLDESQLEALKIGLTRQISVIQGPPGTGKTYLGLRLTEVLLANGGLRERRKPLFVMCFTNHALDQFLEGLLQCPTLAGSGGRGPSPGDLVRIGGRSSSTALEPYNLRERRSAARDDRNDDNVSRLFRRLTWMLKDLEGRINDLQPHMSAGARLPLYLLERVAPAHQMASLHAGYQELLALEEAAQLHAAADDNEHGWQRAGPTALEARGALATWLETPARGELVPLDAAAGLGAARPAAVAAHVQRQGNRFAALQADADMDDEAALVDGMMRAREATEAGLARAAGLERDDDEAPLAAGLSDDEGDDEGELEEAAPAGGEAQADMAAAAGGEASEAVLLLARDVWALPRARRHRLYGAWLRLFQDSRRDELHRLVRQYNEVCRQQEELQYLRDLEILRGAKVVGMTTTGAAKHHQLVQQLGAEVVIVEEAAEVLEAHVLVALTPATKHLILIGDHQQLRPAVAVYDLSKKFHLDLSLFERLVRNGVDHATLSTQRRMRPEISAQIRASLYQMLRDHPEVLGRPAIRGVASDVFFLDHRAPEDAADAESASRTNQPEAALIAAFARYLVLQGYKAESITALTFYLGQSFRIKDALRRLGVDGVRVRTVDKYQGEENDIVLLSVVRSNASGVVGHVGVDNRICVAVSRARLGFYAFGNAEMLTAWSKKSSRSHLWEKVLGSMRAQRAVGPRLVLRCQQHPRTETAVQTADDFKHVKDGGCSLPCDARLDCGHQCPRSCHPDDREHVEIRCSKPCERRQAVCGHPCVNASQHPKRCHEECGQCLFLMEKRLPCKHVRPLACSMPAEAAVCGEPCRRRAPCGQHICTRRCGQACVERCDITVTKPLPCGHQKPVPCWQDPASAFCVEPCGAVLECGHACAGSCGACQQGRHHVACGANCGRTLVCGHQCADKCSKSCTPCRRPCENRCVHSRCTKKCGAACAPCTEPCPWRCEHLRCTRLCSEACERPRCSRPCPLALACGHACLGYCGEPCPPLCRACSPQHEAFEVFFGAEDEPGARFVALECGHSIEGGGLDRWMDEAPVGNAIVLKGCPRCKTPIRRSLRYGAIIKRRLAQIEDIKRRIAEMQRELKEKAARLLEQLDSTPELQGIQPKEIADAVQRLRERLDPGRPPDADIICTAENQIALLRPMAQLLRAREAALNLRAGATDADRQRLEARRAAMLRRASELARAAFGRSEVGEAELVHIHAEVKALLRERNALVRDAPTPEEIAAIVRAVGLSQGHWFECPNGHPYAIGDCGGAMERARCPECGATVGGQNHGLAAGNRLATRIDGARHAAWSDAANMANFDPAEFMD